MVRQRNSRGWSLALMSVAGRFAVVALLAGSPAQAHSGSVRPLVEVTDFGGLSASPDGTHVVFRTEQADLQGNRYRLEWHALDIATSRLTDIGGGGEAIEVDPGLLQIREPVWLPDGQSVAVETLIDGAIGVWRAFIDGSAMEPLIIHDADVEKLSAAPDGHSLIYSLGPSREEIARAEKDEYDRGILVDGSVDLAQNLFRGGSVDGRMASQRLVGYWFIRAGLTWRWPRQDYRYNLESGREEKLGPPHALEKFEVPSMTATASARAGDGSIAQAQWDGAKGSISVRLQGDATSINCPTTQCATGRVSWLAWRPGTRQLLIAFIDRARRQSLGLWNVATGRLTPIALGDGLLSGSRSPSTPCAVTQAFAICVAASAISPPRLERIDLVTGARQVLLDPNSAFRRSYQPIIEPLSWTTTDGPVSAILLRPANAGARALPLFVNYYHCDGFLRGGEGDAWPIPALVDAGFAVACINLVPFSGKQDAVATYNTGLEVLRTLVAHLAGRRLIDPTRVAMGGFSFGSEVAIWTAMNSKLLAALAISSAQAEPGGYWFDTLDAADRAKMTRAVWHLGAPDETPKQWKIVSPALNIDHLRLPILFQLPEQEARRIPELYGRLRQAGAPTELYAYPDEDHLIIQPRHRLAVFERNLDWFRYWLQGARDPDPAKADQYARWDRLRAGRNPSAISAMSAAKARAP